MVRFIGFIDGYTYELIDARGLIGLLYVDGWNEPQWCSFDTILPPLTNGPGN